MAAIPQAKALVKRYYYTYDYSNGARWAFFALFLVALLIAVFGTIRVNKNRLKRGEAPLYGTSWITPPAYRTNNPPQENYVPTYTATANEADMGYYDQQGNFHQNPNVKSPEPAYMRNNATGTTTYENYSTTTYYMGSDAPIVSEATTGQYPRPEGPPGASQGTSTGASAPAGEAATGTSQPLYSRPEAPPPSAGKS
ncbi:hypothetical protein PUMCH_001293 [Australozyma saopauloensis]|uniref:Uncharacterized protein n=1 Tax=Australozyma saopauloensis TaxID=291208 RepID=A0AAX4H690_9ASCO|nr:hypothetical protein PUMCH_001293 [[Candida] saopauloensis]